MTITISNSWWEISMPFRGQDGKTLSHKERHDLASKVEKKFPKYFREKFKTPEAGAARASEIIKATGIKVMSLETCALDF